MSVVEGCVGGRGGENWCQTLTGRDARCKQWVRAKASSHERIGIGGAQWHSGMRLII